MFLSIQLLKIAAIFVHCEHRRTNIAWFFFVTYQIKLRTIFSIRNFRIIKISNWMATKVVKNVVNSFYRHYYRRVNFIWIIWNNFFYFTRHVETDKDECWKASWKWYWEEAERRHKTRNNYTLTALDIATTPYVKATEETKTTNVTARSAHK